MSRSLIAAGTIVLVAGLFWAGVHNGRERRLKMQEASDSHAVLVPDAATSGAASRAGGDTGQGMTPKLQGKVAPAFTLNDTYYTKVSLAEYKGKPVLLNFWATWCGPCKIEMPWFEEFHHKYPDLVILGVAADDASNPVVAATAKKLGVSYPILFRDDAIESAYGGVDYLPESFYIGRDGKVMLETAGLNDNAGGKDEIEANIKKLLAAGAQ